MKSKKSHLFQKEVECLCHIVGRRELKVPDKNIRGLKKASSPRCKKDLRSFSGCAMSIGGLSRTTPKWRGRCL